MPVLLAFVSQEAIIAFGLKNKVAPARIFFFRDGVSEGEYDKVVADKEALMMYIALFFQLITF